MNVGTLAAMIDLTLLKSDASQKEIARLCRDANKHHFCSVCINPLHVKQAAKILAGTGVKVCCVVGFPLGASRTTVKVLETRLAIEDGASEIDMVMNIGALKDGNLSVVTDDIKAVVGCSHAGGAITKVILETCLLTWEEKAAACRACIEAGADFVKTSTGFSTDGATTEDVAFLSKYVSAKKLGVKASGGILSLADAISMIKAGATRLGCSAGVTIIKEAKMALG